MAYKGLARWLQFTPNLLNRKYLFTAYNGVPQFRRMSQLGYRQFNSAGDNLETGAQCFAIRTCQLHDPFDVNSGTSEGPGAPNGYGAMATLYKHYVVLNCDIMFRVKGPVAETGNRFQFRYFPSSSSYTAGQNEQGAASAQTAYNEAKVNPGIRTFTLWESAHGSNTYHLGHVKSKWKKAHVNTAKWILAAQGSSNETLEFLTQVDTTSLGRPNNSAFLNLHRYQENDDGSIVYPSNTKDMIIEVFLKFDVVYYEPLTAAL